MTHAATHQPGQTTHAELLRLAEEQAALRRVATLVAEGATQDDLLSAVAEEVAQLLGVSSVSVVRYESAGSSVVVASLNDPGFPVGSRWALEGPSLNAEVLKSGRPARLDHAKLTSPVALAARSSGVQSGVGVPITVDGEVWGMVAVGTRDRDEALPTETEQRLAAFTELVATAISNAESRDSLRRLADEQAALHRVAALVAAAAPHEEVFAAVAEEVARLLGLSRVEMARYESDGTATVIGASGDHPFPVGSRWVLDGPSVLRSVISARRYARIDDYSRLDGSIAEVAQAAGFRSAIGAPIIVGGRIWGAVIAISTQSEPIPEGSEIRLSLFTDLIATAVSNVQARDDLSDLATEQAALRRVATLVAEGGTAKQLFAAVGQEVARVLDNPVVELVRYESEDSMIVLASENDPMFPVGSRWPLDGTSVTALVLETGRTARIDDYSELPGSLAEATRNSAITASVGVPILVEGVVWGMLAVSATESEPLRPGIEARLHDFGELLATAISNTESRNRIDRLVEEQTALRRLATLVAEGTTSQAVFDAVCAEAGRLIGAASVNLSHYTPDGFNVTMAGWSLRDTHVPVGTRFPLTPDTVGGVIVQTRAPARVDSWEGATSELARLVRERGVRSSLGAPVIVEGQLWGALVAATDDEEPLAMGTEFRLARFTELIATAISNAATRSELIASRARIVAAGDEARRRIERNLHDGTQQRLIAIGLDLQRVRASLPEDQDEARSGLDLVAEDLESVLEDVRELSRGLHPALLSRAGLGPSLRALARRCPIPVEIDIALPERPPAEIETAVYYVAAEALTNAIKHSEASSISVRVVPEGAHLRATIVDDGVGGARPAEGSGLTGLVDRVDALGGQLVLESPPAGGTKVSIVVPLEAATTF